MAHRTDGQQRAQLLDDLLRARMLLFNEFEHKLKTSFSVICGWADTLVEQWEDLADVDRLDGLIALRRKAHEVVDQAAALLEETQVELATLDHPPAILDLAAVARELASGYADTERLHSMRYEGPEVAPVEVDPASLQQVVGLLVENAVKYSPGGGDIVLRIEDPPVDGHVRLAVVDQGIGIPDGVDVWAPFVRGADAREISGIGLGLYVVRNLVRAMGGEVEAFRNQGTRGSTFVVSLRRPQE